MILLLNSIFLISSCNSQTIGVCFGEVNSGLKHLSSSTLELKKGNTFKLANSTTSLEAVMPSTNIYEITGKFQKRKGEIILFPKEKRTSWLTYGKNPNKTKTKGARNTRYIVVDTIYGQKQTLQTLDTLEFKFSIKPNSKYIWNDQNCYIKYDHTELSTDLTNYRSKIKGQINLKNIPDKTYNGKLFYWEDKNNDFLNFPQKSIIEFKNDTIFIIDFPLDPAGMLRYSYGSFKIDEESHEIKCKIKKSVVFSMNIGQVVNFTKESKTIINLSISGKGDLIRKHRKDGLKLSSDGKWISTGSAFMKYSLYDPSNLPIKYKWISRLKK